MPDFKVTAGLIVMLAFAVVVASMVPPSLERQVEERFAWVQFTYNYSQHEWCVDAQRRGANPGEMTGGCFKTLREAQEEILK